MLDEKEKVKALRSAVDDGNPLRSELTTNKRVIARVTDGIYRQPGSAIRELIANAYDADATWVHVNTNAPKFNQISVEDNGNGMSPEAVVYMLSNIGGSAKRAHRGRELSITSEDDSSLSPGGRKLIGKLGIGIFSVSQLTRSFQLITKTRGDDYRTVVLVNLHQFSDSDTKDADEHEKTGSYAAWREKADDVNAHGTTIVLTAIRKQTKDILSSSDLWNSFKVGDEGQIDLPLHVNIPRYYIGHVDDADFYVSYERRDKRQKAIEIRNLPWGWKDDPSTSFKKMVDAVWEDGKQNSKVKLESFFDNYLQMIWKLSLALPLPYVDKSPFEKSVANDWAYFYKLSNSLKGTAELLKVPDGVDSSLTVSELSGIASPDEKTGEFDVTIDDVKLFRPLRFDDLPSTQNIVKKPLLFVGEYRQEFSSLHLEHSGGTLAFKAYMLWAPRLIPTEHQGCLVRIHGASGTLYDASFFDYQVAELTRKAQVTCEIFVDEGLEGALNIDRESFNVSHPHTVVLAAWVHSAFRQLSTAQKALGKRLREEDKSERARHAASIMERVVQDANEFMTDGEGEIPSVELVDENDSVKPQVHEGPTLRYAIRGDVAHTSIGVPGEGKQRTQDEKKVQAIMQLLYVYGLLDDLAEEEQSRLASGILGIIGVHDV